MMSVLILAGRAWRRVPALGEGLGGRGPPGRRGGGERLGLSGPNPMAASPAQTSPRRALAEARGWAHRLSARAPARCRLVPPPVR